MKTRLCSLLAVLLLAVFAGCMRSDAEKWHVIQEHIRTASPPILFRGIPHPLFDSAGYRRVRSGVVQEVPGGLVFPDQLVMSNQDQTLLTKTILTIPKLKKYGGPYKDGGFWPVYAVRWESPSGAVVISFGAANHVVEIESRQIRLRGELADEKDREILAALFTAAEKEREQILIRSAYEPTTQ